MTLRQARGGSFGEQAVQLGGVAAALLGWRPAEFWESTPAELECSLGQGGEAEQIGPAEIERLRLLFPDD